MRPLLVGLLCLWLVGSSACGAPAPAAGAQDAHDAQLAPAEAPKPAPSALPQGTRRSPSPREARVIEELMGSAERVRGLQFKQSVPVLVEDRDRITSYVETQIEDEELDRARVVYAALGLLAPDLDVRALLLRLMGEQVVGYYDAEAKHLVVRDDVMLAFARGDDANAEEGSDLSEARIVLVHELVHALQDQHLHLFEHIKAERDTDADNAFHALVEGDATLAMIGYALEREHIPLERLTSNPAQVKSFSDVVRRSPLAGTELEQAPAIVRVPLLSAYVDGLAFCAALHGTGGFAAIDRAHGQPPVSSEQVLHPERFVHADMPEALALPELPELAAAGYELVREDTLGELEIGVYFGQGLREADAKRAADGWDGDRLRVYRSQHLPPAVVWLSAWDSERDAQEAENAAARVAAQTGTPAADRWQVVRNGKRLLILRELSPELRARIPQLALTR
ncbi:MAG TPA: hypothetical protein VJV78_31055 [Polyangiales bacterium]|nr:hypothetical protein [Polyangiales bacterium]